MAASYPVVTRNVKLDAATARRNGGSIKIYSGSRPANGDASIGAAVLLAHATFASPAYGAAASGVATANALTSPTVVASGTASFYRCFQSDGTTKEGDGDVGTSGTEMVLNTVTIVLGGTLAISSLTMSEP